MKEVAHAKPHGESAQVRTPAAREKLTLVDRVSAAEPPAPAGNPIARTGKRVWAAVRRVNKRVGEAEARLILRVFYYAVFGVLSLVRRKPIDEDDGTTVVWIPRESPGTDPTKQY